ncbi:hypothetical protein EAG_05050 [Camponotus floridanus]|uniref:Uncharacterized protein n=1 Tax=Camponotus floridanus TaxID=104421 RepID=E2A9A0_CAMFO|nr:hypothetical protein EAG_05050 [Camponotus floridanus]
MKVYDMSSNKNISLPAHGTSNPQGPAGAGDIVSTPPPSSSVSGVGIGEERTTASVLGSVAGEITVLEDFMEDLFENVEDVVFFSSRLAGDLDDDGVASPELVAAAQDFLQRLAMGLQVRRRGRFSEVRSI